MTSESPAAGALVLYTDPLTPNSGGNPERWAVILGGVPGRTLAEVYSTVGQALGTRTNRMAHRLGLGPEVVAQKIALFFSTGTERELQLAALRNEIPVKLERDSSRLMGYAFPTQSPKTQRQAFEKIVTLTTRFPGLRFVFLRSKWMQGVPTLKDSIAALWDHPDGPLDPEWSFWRTFAATCLSETSIAVMLEETPVSQLATCLKDNGGLSLIERLLIAHGCETGADFTFSNALCIRYLGGILELPGFWLNIRIVHSEVARKLCLGMVRILKDIGVDIFPSDESLRSESSFDYEGVDFLADTILVGMSNWFKKIDATNWVGQSWYASFREVVQILRRPLSAALLPNSFSRATSDSLEKYIPTIYREVEFDIMVETSTNVIPPAATGLYYSEYIDISDEEFRSRGSVLPSPPPVKDSAVSFKSMQVFKVVVLGDGAVGKSFLINRLLNDAYIYDYDPTIEGVCLRHGRGP
ncbi:hypothetical protein MVEN_01160900 [Mycena venus]|uniref:Uncharacterized protein n=1 Tax=Mycena venus TaxID=2733690 RepID=A0A8H7CXN7_9AGAR|nr:hypothetical protein MVEN_01160900 [Mycena venus]